MRIDSTGFIWHKAVMGCNQNGRPAVSVRAVCRFLWAVLAVVHAGTAAAGDLEEIRKKGVVRHLGIPYARFVTGSGDGLDVEIIQMFAASLGLDYAFVPTTWKGALGDLTGRDMLSGKKVPVRGDILASGITVLPRRKKRVCFTRPVFTSQVWLVASADDPLDPICPGNEVLADIQAVMAKVRGRTVTGVAHTCLDPHLYGLEEAGARIRYFGGRLNELAPFIIDTDAALTLLDVPDALVAMEKWPGQLKVIGPVSPAQKMAAAVAKDSKALARAFNLFFRTLKHQGRYQAMVERYYPGYTRYFPSFFASPGQGPSRPDPGGDGR